jgi:hypothetical protein
VITPVGCSDPNEEQRVIDEFTDGATILPLASKFYSCILDFRVPGYASPLLTLFTKHDDQPNPPIFEEPRPGDLQVSLPRDFLSQAYNVIREDQARTWHPRK